MPFIVQCPDAACRKFMLLEDDQREETVACLVCKKPFDVEHSEEVIACPACQSQLKLPASSRHQTIQCARCQHVFDFR